MIKRRPSTDLDALEGFIDGLAVVLGAGGTVPEAIRVLASAGPSSLRPALADAIAAREAGESAAQVLGELDARLGPEFTPVVRALLAAERDGAPLGGLLETLAAEARTARRLADEASARTLPVRLLFPLVCCALPAVLIGTVVPLLLVVVDGTALP